MFLVRYYFNFLVKVSYHCKGSKISEKNTKANAFFINIDSNFAHKTKNMYLCAKLNLL